MTRRKHCKKMTAEVAAALLSEGTKRGAAGARGSIEGLSLDQAWRDVQAAAAAKLAPIARRIKWDDDNGPEI